MSKFPVKKFRHNASGTTVEGELVLESHTAWQVAVGGKVQLLEKTDWSLVAANGFEDIFSMFGGGRFGGS
jgi:hypothetical protein